MVGVLKFENKPLTIRWYLVNSLYTTRLPSEPKKHQYNRKTFRTVNKRIFSFLIVKLIA